MKFSRLGSLALIVFTAINSRAQGSISGTVFDSLSSHRELANATVVLIERNRYATTDKRGHFAFDTVPDGHYTIGVMHEILDSLDVQLPATPVEVSGNRPTTVQIFTPSRKTLALTVARRRAAASRAAAQESAASDSETMISPRAQKLAGITIDETAVAPTWMERSGFETRRAQGMGAFLTEEEIARHGFSDLTSVLDGMRGVHVAFGPAPRSQSGISIPSVYLLGPGGVRCLPTFFLDGAPFQGYRDLSAIVQPGLIKGIEIYSSPGTMPVQYDRTASTFCGSIVIWTR